jgi:uncharacterized membrane protein YdjX (TVP38/TMEM64 family)
MTGVGQDNRDDTASETADEPTRRGRLKKLVVVLVIGGLFAVAYVFYGDQLTLANLAEQEDALMAYGKAHPLGVFAAAFLLYVAVTAASLPAAGLCTLAYGWFFGFWQALLLVSFASTMGATLAFLLTRYLFREAVQKRFGDRLAGFNRALEREGAFYLFTLRLIPQVPFFLINIMMGLTPLRARTFWCVSQAGMLPGTCVFVYAGTTFPTAQKLAEEGLSGILTPQILIAFLLLGLFPLAVKKIMARIRPASVEPTE